MSGLTLSRRPGESIMIGDDITLTVVRVDGNIVRINVVAPADVVVDREEVRARRLAGNSGHDRPIRGAIKAVKP
jgi:carbon storage regulator